MEHACVGLAYLTAGHGAEYHVASGTGCQTLPAGRRGVFVSDILCNAFLRQRQGAGHRAALGRYRLGQMYGNPIVVYAQPEAAASSSWVTRAADSRTSRLARPAM